MRLSVIYVFFLILIYYFHFALLVSCKMNNVYGRPGPNSIWATTALGDVFVYDPVIAEVNGEHKID